MELDPHPEGKVVQGAPGEAVDIACRERRGLRRGGAFWPTGPGLWPEGRQHCHPVSDAEEEGGGGRRVAAGKGGSGGSKRQGGTARGQQALLFL